LNGKANQRLRYKYDYDQWKVGKEGNQDLRRATTTVQDSSSNKTLRPRQGREKTEPLEGSYRDLNESVLFS
jgi:hypothetical protein